MSKKWIAIATLVTGTAHAGGMFLPIRGVRPAGRGGAFVAGADDVGAMWYDPAGLANLAGGPSKTELLVDASYVGHSVTYTRIDSGDNTLPAVEDSPQPTAIPTLGAAFDIGKKGVLAVGLFAPDASLDGYPENGAQRYALVSMHNTVIAIAEAALGWKVTDTLRLGAGVQDMIVLFHSRTMFSACPGQTVCAPEDPEFDALGEIQGNDFFSPSAVLGAQLDAAKNVTIGATFQLPFHVSSSGTIRTRLPSSGFYNGSHIEGDQADFALDFPAAIRLGVEVRPSRKTKVEVGFDTELWSVQDKIQVTPHNVRVEDAAGVGTYDLGPITIPRKMKNTYAGRIGVEALLGKSFTLRGGYVYETGATSDEYISVLTVDTPKHVLTLGLGVQTGKVRIDAVFAHAFMATADVPFGTSCVPLINPIRSGETPSAPPPGQSCVHDSDPDHVYVGDGTYVSSWNVLGVGASMDF